MSRVLGVIPARIGSTRLSRKPLQLLLGVPLVLWVWRRVRQMAFIDRLVVATDSPEIQGACFEAGAEVVLTSAAHPSGSDRVCEAADRLGETFDVIVNIQGDEPLVAAAAVQGAIGMVARGFEIGTCAAPARSLAELDDPASVKVVRSLDGTALYFSRAPIPFRREGIRGAGAKASGPGPASVAPPDGCLLHVGVYAYQREALVRWVALGPSPLERMEGLEQLRALENGMRIGVALVAGAEGGIDTPEDLSRMEARLRSLGYGESGAAEAGGSGPFQRQIGEELGARERRLART